MSRSNSAAPRLLGRLLSLAGCSPALRGSVLNLRQSILVLGRAPRAKPPRIGGGAIVAVVVTIAAIVASMFLLEPAASDWARQLPSWVTGPADEITNFGLSGRFLYPLGVIILLLSALIGPWLPRITQGVLMTLVARFGFLFIAIGLPSLFDTIVKRLIGRARPYIGPATILSLTSRLCGRPNTPACRPGTRRRRRRPRLRSALFGLARAS